MTDGWNPWHGCHKHSAGCAHCYVYRMDAEHERDASVVRRTGAFDLPVRRARDGAYKVKPGETLYTCFSSDFLVEEADAWRLEAWRMMRERPDVMFIFFTKRVERLADCLPPDWGAGYPNVTIGATCENQDRADFRLPIFLSIPIARRWMICEPMLSEIDAEAHLETGGIHGVVAGGESGAKARLCRFSWVLSLAEQCARAGVLFRFKQTGALFEKDGRAYAVPRARQMEQAARAGIDTWRAREASDAPEHAYNPDKEEGDAHERGTLPIP